MLSTWAQLPTQLSLSPSHYSGPPLCLRPGFQGWAAGDELRSSLSPWLTQAEDVPEKKKKSGCFMVTLRPEGPPQPTPPPGSIQYLLSGEIKAISLWGSCLPGLGQGRLKMPILGRMMGVSAASVLEEMDATLFL